MIEYKFGANILENLTTGMYQDSKVIYREYIQNACDQIDKAVKDGLIGSDEGFIQIWLDKKQRSIIIEDNATGIPCSSFQQTLGNIADSDKKIGEDKGFRGIGRLCGLAYCKELKFISSVKGEDIISIMVCDAEKMRKLIDENTHGKKYSANDVLQAINSFEQQKKENIELHFFRVEMNDINIENTDLLDLQLVKDYLSFVAPVPYQNSFYYRKKIYNHSQELNIQLDEYNIKLDGEQIFKKYTTVLKESSGNIYDNIFDVTFKNFNINGELFAWMWVGISKFQKAIPKNNQMRGLRLRKDNIQIGSEDVFQKLFKQDRGNSYFIGEVFAVNKDLIPNSQRDYFNENQARTVFETELKKYFNDDLYKIYYDGSTINSAYKKIDDYDRKQQEFNEKDSAELFVNQEHRSKELEVVKEKKIKADDAHEKILKMKNKADDITRKVIDRIEKDRNNKPIGEIISTEDCNENTNKITYRVNRLSRLNKAERKLVSKIYSIITNSTNNETAEIIIGKIEEEFK